MLEFDWGAVVLFRPVISLLLVSKLRVDVISIVFDARARMSVGLRDFSYVFTGSVHFVLADSLLRLGWFVEYFGFGFFANCSLGCSVICLRVSVSLCVFVCVCFRILGLG